MPFRSIASAAPKAFLGIKYVSRFTADLLIPLRHFNWTPAQWAQS
jgi:hypothetical protein